MIYLILRSLQLCTICSRSLTSILCTHRGCLSRYIPFIWTGIYRILWITWFQYYSTSTLDGRGLWPRSCALIVVACLDTSPLSELGFIGLLWITWFQDYSILYTRWSRSLTSILYTHRGCLSRYIPFIWTGIYRILWITWFQDYSIR